MPELIDRAVQIWFDGGSPDTVWDVLNHCYANFGDPLVVHQSVLDGADLVIKTLMV